MTPVSSPAPPAQRIDSAASAPARTFPPGVERAILYVLGMAAWLMYFVSGRFLDLPHAITLTTPLDRLIPLVPAWTFVYIAIYAVVLVPAIQIRCLSLLRRYVIAFALMQLVGNVIFVVFPTKILQPVEQLDPNSFSAWGINWYWALDAPPMKCFPSLHVANASLVALMGLGLDRRIGTVLATIAVGIALSTLFVKQHYVVDVLAGMLLAALIYQLLLAPLIRRAEATAGGTASLCFPRAWLAWLLVLYVVGVNIVWLLYHVVHGVRP